MTARLGRASRVSTFGVVQAAQRFLVDALPLRHPGTAEALEEFCQALPSAGFERIAAEAITITVIRKLGARSGVGPETLLNGYFLLDESLPLADRFRSCVENLLHARGVRHPAVAAALANLDVACADPRLRLESIAHELGVSPSHLAHLISVHTGERFRAHLRHARMRLAVRKLRVSGNIQEVAAAVGYLHPADFNHHFKRQFGVTPTVYRARLAAAGDVERVRALQAVDGKKAMAKASIARADESAAVVLVEDDATTRDTFELFLRGVGYAVESVATPEAARAAVGRVSPAAIIVDRWIGDVDAVAFACEAGRTSAGRVALLTGDFALEPDALADLTASGVRVAFKPLDLEDLLRLVRTLEGSRGRRTG